MESGIKHYNEEGYKIFAERFAGLFQKKSGEAMGIACFMCNGSMRDALTEEQVNEMGWRLEYCLVVEAINAIEKDAVLEDDHWLKADVKQLRKDLKL